MTRETMSRILGAVYSLTYSLYPIAMKEERNELVRKALAMTAQEPSEEEIAQLLFAIQQSKIELDPGCQCMINHGYYPDDFTDGLRKLTQEDADGQAARELFVVLQKPDPAWEPELLYRAIRATYNREYHAEKIRAIREELRG
jgi:hypothetical protein